ncbi:hypothetical protein STEG23_003030 [Scotinomys teguina]
MALANEPNPPRTVFDKSESLGEKTVKALRAQLRKCDVILSSRKHESLTEELVLDPICQQKGQPQQDSSQQTLYWSSFMVDRIDEEQRTQNPGAGCLYTVLRSVSTSDWSRYLLSETNRLLGDYSKIKSNKIKQKLTAELDRTNKKEEKSSRKEFHCLKMSSQNSHLPALDMRKAEGNEYSGEAGIAQKSYPSNTHRHADVNASLMINQLIFVKLFHYRLAGKTEMGPSWSKPARQTHYFGKFRVQLRDLASIHLECDLKSSHRPCLDVNYTTRRVAKVKDKKNREQRNVGLDNDILSI